MAELPDDTYAALLRCSTEGDEFADKGEFEQALSRYRQAWQLLPEPRCEWDAAEWLLAAIGDSEFQRGEFAAARTALMDAMKFFESARGNPFVRLRLGQCMFETGEEAEAANWMGLAFLTEGLKLFEGEHPKYLAFVKSKLQPPPGGWPEGW
ncbi:MAG: tetratricopeptide repeat protein [Planctomycetes bacterium]|nr:tetratricopeptide repeat protein [Planctomycetota bacterium]